MIIPELILQNKNIINLNESGARIAMRCKQLNKQGGREREENKMLKPANRATQSVSVLLIECKFV